MARPSRFSPEVRDCAVRMVLEHGAVMLGEDAGTHAWMLSRRNLPPRLHNNSSRKRDHPTGENAPHHRAVLFGQEWTGLQGERVWLCYPAADVLTQRSANEAAAPRGERDGTGARTAIRVRDGAPDEPDPTPRGVRGAHGALPSLAAGDLPTCAYNRGSGRWKRPGGSARDQRRMRCGSQRSSTRWAVGPGVTMCARRSPPRPRRAWGPVYFRRELPPTAGPAGLE
jgi:hypothetical protein